MAKRSATATSISITDDTIEVRIGEAQAMAPVGQLDALITALEAARLVVGGSPRPSAAAVASPAATPTAAAPVASAAKKKRRSRKRVGDAMQRWMEDNPGWHHVDALLEAVIANEMTDASPKRALKIALGKQRDEIFETDGHGHWKLVKDTDAGPPPKARKKGKSRSKGRASSRAKKGRKAKGGGDAKAKGPKAKAEPDPAEVDEDLLPVEEAPAARVVLVKPGQSRKELTMPPGEKEARERVSRRRGRWEDADPALVERARAALAGVPKPS